MRCGGITYMKYWVYLAISYDVYRVFNKPFSTIDDLEYIITVQIILIMELQFN